ncbi:MAG: uroporphyrinogen decarboxylase family protein [Anaerolineae bacterium]
MTPYERTMERLRGQPVDRVPNQNILMAYAARYIGATYSQLAQDHRVLVESNLRACADLHIDLVSAISDPWREASAFGAEITFPEDSVPACHDPLLTSSADWTTLQPWDPWAHPRTRDRLQAIDLYRQRVAGHYPICGWVEGAAAEAADLRGVSAFLEDLALEPEAAHNLMAVCCETGTRFALAQVKAGADIVGIGDAVASLMNPRMYRAFAWPYERKMIDAIHQAGALVKLHICGNTSRHIADMVATGADIIDIDWMVDMGQAVATCGGRAAINGNYDPVDVLLQGTPAEVYAATLACVQAGDSKAFVSAGCEVPVETPKENLLAHYRAVCDAGSQEGVSL